MIIEVAKGPPKTIPTKKKLVNTIPAMAEFAHNLILRLDPNLIA